MCLLASMHIKCQCQRKVHAYRLLASMLVQMFSACMLTTYSAEMLFFRRAAAVSPPHKSLCGARLVCVVCMCGGRACDFATCTSCALCTLCTLCTFYTLCTFCTLCTILPLIWSTIDFTRLAVHLSPIHRSKPTTEQVLWPICWTCVIQIWSSGTINMIKCDVTAVLFSLYALQKQFCS